MQGCLDKQPLADSVCLTAKLYELVQETVQSYICFFVKEES